MRARPPRPPHPPAPTPSGLPGRTREARAVAGPRRGGTARGVRAQAAARSELSKPFRSQHTRPATRSCAARLALGPEARRRLPLRAGDKGFQRYPRSPASRATSAPFPPPRPRHAAPWADAPRHRAPGSRRGRARGGAPRPAAARPSSRCALPTMQLPSLLRPPALWRTLKCSPPLQVRNPPVLRRSPVTRSAAPPSAPRLSILWPLPQPSPALAARPGGVRQVPGGRAARLWAPAPARGHTRSPRPLPRPFPDAQSAPAAVAASSESREREAARRGRQQRHHVMGTAD